MRTGAFICCFGKNGLGVLGAFLHRDSDIAVGSRHVYGAETENQIGHGGVIDTGAVFGNPAFSDLKARMFADAQIVEGGRRDGKAGALGRQSGESSDPASGKGIVDPQSDGVAKKEKCFHSLSLFQQTSLHDSCVSCRSNASILSLPHAGRQCPNTTEYGKSV